MSDVYQIAVPALHYVNIYQQNDGSKLGFPHYAVSFATAAIKGDIREALAKAVYEAEGYGRELIHARNRLRPTVSEREGRYADLKALFDEADVRNIQRDKLLQDTPATVYVSQYEVERPERKYHGLALHGLSISVEDIRL